MNNTAKQLRKRTEYFNPDQGSSYKELGNSVIKMIRESGKEYRNIVLVCIGTDRATGDALGPMVGDYILSSNTYYYVAGSLEYPVHALNLRETIDDIYDKFDNPFIIAIDASLGMSKVMGMVTVTNSHLFPGKGVNKKLPAIGDISITGIVNLSGHTGANLLQNTRLYTVKKMSEYIGMALVYADSHLSSPL